jgi:DNA-binding response OmpR family regulator
MLAAREFAERPAPGVVLALPESPLAAATAEALRRDGWRVYRAATGEDARRLTGRCRLDAAVLSADNRGESGWLTCAKLLRAQPWLRVILVGERSPDGLRFAQFVGAEELVPPSAGAAGLAARVAGAVLQAV